MKRILFFTLICSLIPVLYSCEKSSEPKIPSSLEKSCWSSKTNPDEQITLEFLDAENALYTTTTAEAGSTELQAEYRYTYSKPYLTLTPKGEGESFTGEVISLDAAYIYLKLTSADGSTKANLTQVADKEQTIWQ